MKKLSTFVSKRRMQQLTAYFAATATVAMIALAASAGLNRANAGSHDNHGNHGRHEGEWLQAIYDEAQVAALDQLLADFHGSLSYGGNIDAMMSLWAPNSSLTFNGTTYSGNTAVAGFFTSGGYFHNNWVSLAPEYKTQVTLHGDTADMSTQCIAVDLDSTPNAVRIVIQVHATAVKHGGKWFFTSMNNTSPAPL